MNVVSLLTATLMLAAVFSASRQTTAASTPTPLSQLLIEAVTNNPQISAANHGALAARQIAQQIWIDLGGGLLIAGALAAWVPQHFWQAFLLQGHPVLAKLWGPLVGPIVAIVSFVCSIGNVPLAAVLWNGGISFGGVVAFIFADLIVLPILDIYRKYYGLKISAFLLFIFYASMSLAALAVEFLFGALHLIPEQRQVRLVEESIRWNYTTVLNIIFLVLAAFLVIRFLRTGGPEMMRMINRSDHHEESRSQDANHGHHA